MSRPDQAVFRLPASALFIPILLFFVATPVATGAPPWTLLVYLLPLYALGYVYWTKTVADDTSIRANMPLGRRRILWADLDGFEFQGPRWAVAVTMDGRRTRLPMVRPRDLRRLAAVSGGRLYLGEDAAEQAEAAASEGSLSSSIGAGGHVGADVPAGAAEVASPSVDLADSTGAVTDGPGRHQPGDVPLAADPPHQDEPVHPTAGAGQPE